METLKQRISKSIGIIRYTPKVAQQYLTLSESVFIDGWDDKQVITTKEMKEVNLKDLIFEDFAVVKDFISINEKGEKTILPKGLLIRIFRQSKSSIGVGVFILNLVVNGEYVYCGGISIKKDQPTLVGMAPELRPMMHNIFPNLLEEVRTILYVTQNFHSEVKQATITRSTVAKESEEPKPTHTTYIVNLNKPKYTGTPSGKGGTHASPREHKRRGHYRTSPNGVRYFVNATIVNKGCGFTSEQTYRL